MRDEDAQESSTSISDPGVTALYHGACPVCSVEISHYQGVCERRSIKVGWSDISSGVDAPILEQLGLDREDVKRRMTVLDRAGKIHRGVDAFIVLWREMPGYRHLATVVSLPVIHGLSAFLYDHVLAPILYGWNKRRGR